MSAQGMLAKLGLRLGALGSLSNLAIAAPLAEGDLSPSAHTDSARIGVYFSRTLSQEKIGFVIMGTERAAVTPAGLSIRGLAYSWPTAHGSAGSALVNDGAGALTWANINSAVWGNITGTLSNQTDLVLALAGKETAGAAAAVQGNLDAHTGLTTTAHGGIVASTDPRLTNARTPTAHAASHAPGAADTVFPASVAGFLKNDGAGNLSWSFAGGGNISGSIAAGQVAYGSAADTIQGSNTFTFASGTLTLNLSGAALVAPPAGTVIHASDGGGLSRMMLDAFGVDNYSAFAGRFARGTSATKTAVQSGDAILHLSGWGYGATGYSASFRASVVLTAAENWTDAAQGTNISFNTTLAAGVVTNEKVRIWSDGGVQIGGPFATSPGVGGLSTTANGHTCSLTNLSDPRLSLGTTSNYSRPTIAMASGIGPKTWFVLKGLPGIYNPSSPIADAFVIGYNGTGNINAITGAVTCLKSGQVTIPTLGVGTVYSATLGTVAKLTVNPNALTDNAAAVQINTGGDANKGVIIQRNSATQSANLLECQTSNGAVLAAVTATGGLTTAGARVKATTSIAATGGTTAMAATDNVVVFTGSNAHTYTLTASGSTETGRQVYVKNRASGSVTINRGGSDTIDGATSYIVPPGAAILLLLNGTDWCVF